jgi:hypothetical protein
MKVNLLLLAAALTAASLRATPLTETTAVQTRPEADAPAIAVLTAGTEPTLAANVTAPPGWLAVELSGPYEAYVQNKDFLKSLDLHPGALIRTAPKLDAPVLTTAERGDDIEIIGLFGKWTQVKFSKKIIGYIQLAGAMPAAPPPTPAPEIAAAPAPAPAAVDSNTPGHATLSRHAGPMTTSSMTPPAPAWPTSMSATCSSPYRWKTTSATPSMFTAPSKR